MVSRLAYVLLLVCGCAQRPDAPPPPERHLKPQAPVELRAEVDGERVTLTATPTRDVDRLELRLGEARRVFGPTARGQERTLSVRQAGEVIGAATAAGRTKAIVARPRAPAPVSHSVVELPGHGRVAEVRP
jgi:hypothetical protein